MMPSNLQLTCVLLAFAAASAFDPLSIISQQIHKIDNAAKGLTGEALNAFQYQVSSYQVGVLQKFYQSKPANYQGFSRAKQNLIKFGEQSEQVLGNLKDNLEQMEEKYKYAKDMQLHIIGRAVDNFKYLLQNRKVTEENLDKVQLESIKLNMEIEEAEKRSNAFLKIAVPFQDDVKRANYAWTALVGYMHDYSKLEERECLVASRASVSGHRGKRSVWSWITGAAKDIYDTGRNLVTTPVKTVQKLARPVQNIYVTSITSITSITAIGSQATFIEKVRQNPCPEMAKKMEQFIKMIIDRDSQIGRVASRRANQFVQEFGQTSAAFAVVKEVSGKIRQMKTSELKNISIKPLLRHLCAAISNNHARGTIWVQAVSEAELNDMNNLCFQD